VRGAGTDGAPGESEPVRAELRHCGHQRRARNLCAGGGGGGGGAGGGGGGEEARRQPSWHPQLQGDSCGQAEKILMVAVA